MRGLERAFGDNQALSPTDLDIGPGGITGLLGPNGSGKSTLLRCLIGLVPRDGGSVQVDGKELEGDGVAIRKAVSYAPGEIALYRRMRGEEHLEWLLAGRSREELRRGKELAGSLGLPLRRRVQAYSHGMKRQLLFAAAMAPAVRVRLLDEVTEGLDPSRRGEVLERLREDAARGTTILLSSHHLGEVQRICDRMIFMREGKMLSEKSSEQIAAHSRRIVRLRFAPDADLRRIEEIARSLDAEATPPVAGRVQLLLSTEDPRETLAALLSSHELPAPLTIEYGKLSLQELYSELYGEEAC